jgi:hypothetical protein
MANATIAALRSLLQDQPLDVGLLVVHDPDSGKYGAWLITEDETVLNDAAPFNTPDGAIRALAKKLKETSCGK